MTGDQISRAAQYAFHKHHICHSELETDSDTEMIGRTQMDTNEYRCPVRTNKESLSLCPILKMDAIFLNVIQQGTENFQIANCCEPSAISQMIQFTACLLKKPCVFRFFAAKFSKWPETKRFCEWIKHMDLLKDLRADPTLAPMQCCHSSTVYHRYIFLKSHSTYYDAILFFVYIYRI